MDDWARRNDPVGEQAARDLDRRPRPSPPLDLSVRKKGHKAAKSKKAPLPKTAGAPLFQSQEYLYEE
jgi:hypothetical protein